MFFQVASELFILGKPNLLQPLTDIQHRSSALALLN